MMEDAPAFSRPLETGKLKDFINSLQGFIDHQQLNCDYDSVLEVTVGNMARSSHIGLMWKKHRPYPSWNSGQRKEHLQEGFWHKSRVHASSDTPFLQIGELRADHGAGSHYVGPRFYHYTLSFCPINDVFTGHFMILWPQYPDTHSLIWVCCAL